MSEPRGLLLIVEDDDSLRQIVSRHLRGKGFDVTEAASAEAATAVLDDGLRPDVVFLDINLPIDTGWDLLRGPALRNASPTVLITSAGPVSPKRLLEFRCAGWLPKPYPLETLVDTLDRLIGKERNAREK
ncbi:MAG TPA: response regulator [Candidatus Limnocylindrales bacterium]